MADNFNTYKTIGDTVSFDSLYRGIENMGKAMASARAAKAKAAAKKDDEIMKMIYQKDMDTGKTPLQGLKNRKDFSNFLTTTQNSVAKDPNTGMNTVSDYWSQYKQKSDITTQQSKVEQLLTDAPSQGLAVSPIIGEEYNKAFANGGDMSYFTDQDPKKVLFLARQGITVQPDPNSAIKDANGKITGYSWGYVSATPTKATNLTDELDKVINNDNNFDKTQDIVGTAKDLKGANKDYQTATKQDTYTIKAGKVAQLADEYSNNPEIQKFYLVNNDIFDNKVKTIYLGYKNNSNYSNMSDQQLLSMSARDAIKIDILNTDFNKKKNDLILLSPPAQTNVTVNNKQDIIDNTSLTASSDPRKIKGARALDAINDQAQLNEIAAKLKKNGDNPVRDKFNGKDIVYVRLGPGKVDAYYLDDSTEQSAGFQTQKQKQGQGTGSFIYTPGSMSSELGFYDPETLAPVSESAVSKIMKEGTIDDVVKINGKIYLKYTKTIKDATGISLANENFYYVEMRKDGRLDRAVSSQYNNKGGKKVITMYDWDGWQAESNNASSININD
jgi:hypothetical protein